MGIRVTGGVFRGRIIDSPLSNATRPTGSMAREALFNILQGVDDFAVLDLFAGSGIMGIEAVSRGAESVVAVEMNKAQAAKIKKQYQTLNIANRLTLLEKDALTLLDNDAYLQKFNLIYADPPFKNMTYPDLRPFLKFLAPGGVAVFECPSRNLPEWTNEGKVRKYGESSLAFFYASEP